jgi:hypothetical protein
MSGRRQAIETAIVEILSYLPILGPMAAFAASIAFFSSTVGGPAMWTMPMDAYLPSIAAYGLLAFPFGTYFLMDGVYRLVRARAARSWPQTAGEILSSEVSPTGLPYMRFYMPLVSFRYVVDGNSYEGDAIETARAAYGSESEAVDIAARYPVGTKVQVHYDPQSRFAVLEVGEGAACRRIWFGLIFLLIPLASGLVTVHLNRMM